MEDQSITTGQLISHYRIHRKLTQDTLAELVGLSQSAISQIENGEQDLSVNQLIMFAHALQINTSNLLPPDTNANQISNNTFNDSSNAINVQQNSIDLAKLEELYKEIIKQKDEMIEFLKAQLDKH